MARFFRGSLDINFGLGTDVAEVYILNLKYEFLALLGLSAFAIANPILDTLGHGSTFFVAHGAQTLDILTLTLAIYFLPAILAIAAVGCLQIFSVAAARLLIGIVTGALAGLWAMGIASDFPRPFPSQWPLRSALP